MATAIFRFHGDLEELLRPEQRETAFACEFHGPQTVKHLIEALGVPHTEISSILVSGAPVGLAYRPVEGDEIAVYPEFSHTDATTVPPLRPALPEPPAFLADNHLGRLARYLRLLGFDTAYDAELDDEALADLAADELRVLLTRDRGLLKRRQVTFGYCLRTTDPREQLLAVIRRYRLATQLTPWRRCLRCNGLLRPVDKAAVLDRLEPKTRLYYDEYRQCEQCSQVFWRGSHYADLEKLIADVYRTEAVD